MSNEFQYIVDELNGRRVIERGSNELLIHSGDPTDPNDPRWQVINYTVAWDLMQALERVLKFSDEFGQ